MRSIGWFEDLELTGVRRLRSRRGRRRDAGVAMLGYWFGFGWIEEELDADQKDSRIAKTRDCGGRSRHTHLSSFTTFFYHKSEQNLEILICSVIMHHTFENFVEAAEHIKSLLPVDFVPEIGIICGSGLSGVVEAVTGPRVEVPYSEIKGFPVSTGKLDIMDYVNGFEMYLLC